MKEAKDQFSTQSKVYKKFRPTYPPDLYVAIYEHVKGFENCWDCGTGNGQVAQILAERFDQVYASDLSANQIAEASPNAKIDYSVQRAEQTNYPDQFFDLITVGQALHWFDFEAFNKEVNRVLKPDGVIAVWGYALFRVNSSVDQIIDHFYKEVVGPYWAFERSHIDQHYKTITLDIDPIQEDTILNIELDWDIDQVEGYLNSWSAVQNYMKANEGKSPVPDCIMQLRPFWNDPMKIRIPVFLRMGKRVANARN